MDLDAIEAAEKAMTPGPIAVYEDRVRCYLHGPEEDGGPAGPDGEWLADVAYRYDAAGIVLLRNSAPALIARIREQDAEIERLREACEDYLEWIRTPHHSQPIEETVKQRREILERMEAALEQKGGE